MIQQTTIGLHVTTYNRSLFTDQCLSSIEWSNPKHSKILVVDNASSDNTKEVLTKHISGTPHLYFDIVYNKENKHLGYAVNQGWGILKDGFNILGWINNDFLFEPGWEDNLIACFTELDLDYVVGTVRPDRERSKKITLSGKGQYTDKDDVGAAYFLLSKHFKNGIHPSPEPFQEHYTGPGPDFHRMLQSNKLKGVRLAHPGVLVRNSEYNNPDYVSYYDQTFSIRTREAKLRTFRQQEKEGHPRGWCDWDSFLEKHYK